MKTAVSVICFIILTVSIFLFLGKKTENELRVSGEPQDKHFSSMKKSDDTTVTPNYGVENVDFGKDTLNEISHIETEVDSNIDIEPEIDISDQINIESMVVEEVNEKSEFLLPEDDPARDNLKNIFSKNESSLSQNIDQERVYFDLFSDNEALSKYALENVECRKAVCKISVRVYDEKQIISLSDDILNNIILKSEFADVRFPEDTDGSDIAVFYIRKRA